MITLRPKFTPPLCRRALFSLRLAGGLALAAAGILATRAAVDPGSPLAGSTSLPAGTAAKGPREPVYQARLARYDSVNYDRAVEALISDFERTSHHRLVPGPKKRVGLKVYTDSGPGLATPIPLVKAVIAALERRGFDNRNIFLVGLNQMRLRMTHYLPSLVTGKTSFAGNPIYVLESNRYYDPVWFYDSPLPERFDLILAKQQTQDVPDNTTTDEDRKSFLATPLFLDADFWINLPVYTDHPTLGVNGALVNATLWNASNTARFFHSAANAPRRRGGNERHSGIARDLGLHDRLPRNLPVHRRTLLQQPLHRLRTPGLA